MVCAICSGNCIGDIIDMEIKKKEDFLVEGVSYIGAPKERTVMFITCKVGHLIQNLSSVTDCLVFAETGIEVPDDILRNNSIIFTNSPQRDYAMFVMQHAEMRLERERNRKYKFTEGGYYIGENVKIGENVYIEPGCLIGHDVIIGKNARILYGVVIKNAIIGDNFLANEKAVVGAYGFTMAVDEQGNKMRIPTLGKVIIGDFVEVGAQDNISCGSGGNTMIDDYVKIDALVHIGHDVHLMRNTEITAGGIIGGFVSTGENSYIGINAVLRNRIEIGSNSIIGMGATVTKSVEADTIVVGNPARKFD